jgi:exosome complex RNA-binding protein Csl4
VFFLTSFSFSKNHLAKPDTIVEMHKIRKKRNSYVHPKKKITNIEQEASEMIARITKVLRNEFAV